MIDCLIIGDSIAVGVKRFRPECVDYAKGGITSTGWNKQYGNMDMKANTVIISLGTNDWVKADTYEMLMKIRMKVKGDAKVYGDTVLPTTRWQKDKIHPSWEGYKVLAERTK